MKTFFKNITTNEDVKYSQSYGSAKDFNHFAGYEEHGWLHIYHSSGRYDCKKSTNAKHFHGFKATSITERSFNMLLNKAKAQHDIQVEDYRQQQAAAAETLKAKIAHITEQFKLSLTPERIAEWSTNNEGNSHTRRTRWDNRASRIIGERGYGYLLRDLVYQSK
jgi:hypothetical protein